MSSTDHAASGPTLSAFAVFVGMWAVAGIVHNGSTGDLLNPSVDIVFTLAAWAVILKPTSVLRVACMVVALGPSIWFHAPYITNHWTVYTFGTVWMGVGLLVLGLRARALPSGDALLAYWAPALRIATFIIYFWVVFHKLNETFFDPELSCANEMYGWLAAKFFLPDGAWTAPWAIWGTLIAEAAIPLMLLFRQTRVVGVLFGLAFHTVLGVNGFFNFTVVVTALYSLFLDEDALRRVVSLREIPWADRAARSVVAFARHSATFWVGAAAFVLVMFVPAVTGWDAVQSRAVSRYSTEVVWLLYTGVVGTVLVVAWWNARREMQPEASFRLRGFAWAVAVVFIANGMSPYLGFKTENSFAMFSNLRTEGPYWNHYFVPRSTRVLSFQDELVEVVSSNDPSLEASAAKGGRIVFHTFHRHVSERPDVSVVYRRGGQVHHVPRVADDPVLSVSPPAWRNRWLWFRPVLPPEQTTCQH